MLPWAVRDAASGDVIGSTRYHDIVPAIDRVEIGYTFYAQRWQRTHVNSACKRLLLGHAFDTLGCRVVGVLRHFQARRDGSVRDAYIYSILASEWPAVRARLDERLERGPAPITPL